MNVQDIWITMQTNVDMIETVLRGIIRVSDGEIWKETLSSL